MAGRRTRSGEVVARTTVAPAAEPRESVSGELAVLASTGDRVAPPGWSNTGGAKRTVTPAGSFDTIHSFLRVDWQPAAEELWSKLIEWQTEAQKHPTGEYTARLGQAVICVSGWGRKGPGIYYHAVFSVEGVHFAVCRSEVGDGKYNVKVEAGSLFLMRHGVKGMSKIVTQSLAEIGGLVVDMCHSRVDACVDFVGLDLRQMWLDYLMGKRVCRARKGKLFVEWDTCQPGQAFIDGRSETGFTHGRDTMIRVYDKLLESRRDIEKFTFLIENRWGGEVPASATRVEFQLRNQFLTEHGIRTFADLENFAGTATYLVREWFRLAIRNEDHLEKSVNTDEWETVAKGFEQVYGKSEWKRVKPVYRWDPRQLVRQAAGALAAACVALGVASYGDVVRHLVSEVPATEFSSKVQAKADQRRAARGIGDLAFVGAPSEAPVPLREWESLVADWRSETC